MQYHFKSIEQIIDEFEGIKSRTEYLFANLSIEQYNFKPAPERWSAAECLVHLNLTGNGYLKNIRVENVVDGKMEEPLLLTYLPRFLMKKFAMITGPDSKVKMPSPKFLQATTSKLDKPVVDTFINLQNDFLNIIAKINLLQLRSIKVRWPAFPLMKLQLGEVLIMTIAHEQRHLNQAERALKVFDNLHK